jgi:UDP-3-O-[3-hydroxymyristoyl] glucosamine N-acyltransferase
VSLTLGEIAERIDARLIGDAERVVEGVRPPRSAGPEHITFVSHPRELRHHAIEAGALLTTMEVAAERAHELPCDVLAADDPAHALIDLLALLHPSRAREPGVHPKAEVSSEAKVGAGARIGPFAVVGAAELGDDVDVGAHAFIDDDVVLGAGSRVGPHAVVVAGSRVGERVIVQPGAVVGSPGFGYAPRAGRLVRVPQVGGVVVGDDAEIGANTCVDRGALDDTVIGAGSKIDNLAQLAHGVRLGEDCVVIAQAGLSGGAEIGDRALFAGQSACTQFVVVGEDARVGARAAVQRDIKPREAVSGVPAIGHRDWIKQRAHLRRLDDYAKRLAAAEARIVELESRINGDEE